MWLGPSSTVPLGSWLRCHGVPGGIHLVRITHTGSEHHACPASTMGASALRVRRYSEVRCCALAIGDGVEGEASAGVSALGVEVDLGGLYAQALERGQCSLVVLVVVGHVPITVWVATLA